MARRRRRQKGGEILIGYFPNPIHTGNRSPKVQGILVVFLEDHRHNCEKCMVGVSSGGQEIRYRKQGDPVIVVGVSSSQPLSP